MKKWTVTPEQDGDDLVITFPPEFIEETKWEVGDVIKWIDNNDGSWTLKKIVKMLHIERCSDPLMWYAGMVGTDVVFVKEDDDYYWSREEAGHINIVHKRDATIIEV